MVRSWRQVTPIRVMILCPGSGPESTLDLEVFTEGEARTWKERFCNSKASVHSHECPRPFPNGPVTIHSSSLCWGKRGTQTSHQLLGIRSELILMLRDAKCYPAPLLKGGHAVGRNNKGSLGPGLAHGACSGSTGTFSGHPPSPRTCNWYSHTELLANSYVASLVYNIRAK